MTLPIPLTVRLTTARADKHITHDLRSLQFRSVVPGGFASATFSLDRPVHLSPDEIAYYGDVSIYDARNGNCVWCGRLEDPGRGTNSEGQVWELAAVGPAAHAHDQRRDYVVVDTSVDNWERDSTSRRNGRTELEVDDDDNDTESMVSSWPQGMTVNSADHISWQYLAIARTGQKLARIRILVTNSITSSDWGDRIVVRASGSYNLAHSLTWSTTQHQLLARVGTEFTLGQNKVFLRSRRDGGTAETPAAGVERFSRYDSVMVRAVQMNADGTEITSGYLANSVQAHQIVNDLLGRRLTEYDGADASVDTSSTVPIDQAAWPDGVTAAEVFDELMVLEPTKYWAAWEINAAGKYHFEWRSWPTTVRYEADVNDGFDSPGSAEGLFNRVTVRWLGAKARARTRRRSLAVPLLDDAGLVREEMLDLGGGVGSPANAIQAGDQFLLEHQVPPNAGTLTVARPIYDHDRGTTVMPWEIRPGHLVRVRGIQPNTNSLNVSDRDGVTVFRIVAHSYDAATAAATLELDSYSLSTAQALADLRKKQRQFRKR